MILIIWMYAIAALASALAAVLAWAAKLWWAKEYGSAKDEIIKAKEAQIELLRNEINNLRELTPMKIREYFLSVKTQLEEYNDTIQQQLELAHQQIAEKDSQIAHLKAQPTDDAHYAMHPVGKLLMERKRLDDKVAQLNKELEQLKQGREDIPAIEEDLNRWERLQKTLIDSITIMTPR